jgi:heme-degrading monooxygenase HmoA
MFSVIFEVFPKEGRLDTYLELAGRLKPLLEAVDGFIDNERFESQRRPGCLLSHSTWRDEKSVVRWRTHEGHHGVQKKGRFEIFDDYHLRVGEVTADTGAPQAAIHEQRFDETEVGAAKLVTLTEAVPRTGTAFGRAEDLFAAIGFDAAQRGLADHDVFASIYTPGKVALLASWADARIGNSWSPKTHAGIETLRHRKIRVIRDYGMFDRREAPQFYPDAEGRKTTHSTPVR